MAGTGLHSKDQMAAALAGSSIAFRQSDPLYANKLLSTTTRGLGYANTYSGAYLQFLASEDDSTIKLEHFQSTVNELDHMDPQIHAQIARLEAMISRVEARMEKIETQCLCQQQLHSMFTM